MKTLLTLCFLCTLACSTVAPVVCSVESSVASALSSGIATALSCTNTAQIQSDLLAALGKANLCTQATTAKTTDQKILTGPVGDLVCPLAVSTAIGLLSSKVPTAWGCSPTATASGLATTLTTLCEAAIPI